MPRPGRNCRICNELDRNKLAELNLMCADPMRWPKTIFDQWPDKPKGLPPQYRAWGAAQMAREMLTAWDWPVSDGVIKDHIEYDVPKLAANVASLVEMGMIAMPEEPSRAMEGFAYDPAVFVKYFVRGVELAEQGIELLQERLDAYKEKKEQPPLELVKLMIDTGTKLALAGGNITSSGKKLGPSRTNKPYRDAVAGKDIGRRIGKHRMQVIDGELRAVADEGPADREDYAEKNP